MDQQYESGQLNFDTLAKELKTDCNNKPADCIDAYDEGAPGSTPAFPWADFVSCEDEGFDACSGNARLKLYCKKTCCTCDKSDSSGSQQDNSQQQQSLGESALLRVALGH